MNELIGSKGLRCQPDDVFGVVAALGCDAVAALEGERVDVSGVLELPVVVLEPVWLWVEVDGAFLTLRVGVALVAVLRDMGPCDCRMRRTSASSLRRSSCSVWEKDVSVKR